MWTQVHGKHILAIMPNVDYAFIVALMVVILDSINANDAAINAVNSVIDGVASSA